MENKIPFTSSAKMEIKLKNIAPSQLPRLDVSCRSDTLHPSTNPSDIDPRSYYLANLTADRISPPLISCSDFVPSQMVELLMRRKKDSALGVKFIGMGGFRYSERNRPDEITNMEGAMHTFVTPVIPRCEMIGDYRYDAKLGGHGVALFGDVAREVAKASAKTKFRLTRTVVMSASIHMDFEGVRIMLKACKLDNTEVLGYDLGAKEDWDVLSVEDKQLECKRNEYDSTLRRHMVFHLTQQGKLPARSLVKDAMDVKQAISFLEEVISSKGGVREQMIGLYAKLNNDQVVSLELLYNVATQQIRNEFSALETLCPQGYVYTYDPASIFAREIGPPLLNRLTLAALREVSENNRFQNLKIFAFNNYAEPGIISLVAKALEKQEAVCVVGKNELFQGRGGRYDISAFKEAEGAMLVVHNNSDGFGQNIETEGEHGSLDGAIGSNSSAAASLERSRKDLLDFVV